MKVDRITDIQPRCDRENLHHVWIYVRKYISNGRCLPVRSNAYRASLRKAGIQYNLLIFRLFHHNFGRKTCLSPLRGDLDTINENLDIIDFPVIISDGFAKTNEYFVELHDHI